MPRSGMRRKFRFYPKAGDDFEVYKKVRELIDDAGRSATIPHPMARAQLARYFDDNYLWSFKFISQLVCYDLGHLTGNTTPPVSVLKVEVLPDYETRDRMWNDTERIFKETGWYPYVTGADELDKGVVIDDYIEQAMLHHRADTIGGCAGLGPFEGVRPVSLQDQDVFDTSGGFVGNSYLLRLTDVDLILDAGIPWPNVRKDAFREGAKRLVLISHPHQDHSKAFKDLLADKGTTFMMGFLTLEQLLRQLGDPELKETLLDHDFYSRVIPINFDEPVGFADGSSISAVPTEHYPGSMAFILRFSDGRSLFYSGDLNFASSYYMTRTVMESICGEAFDVSMIDGSFLGGKGRTVPVRSDQDQDEVVEDIGRSMDSGAHNVIVTDARSYGVHIFLALYRKLIDKRGQNEFRPVFVDQEIMDQVRSIEYWLKRPDDRGKHLANDIVEKLAKRYMSRSVKVYSLPCIGGRCIEHLDRVNKNAAFMLDATRLVSDRGYLPSDTVDVLNKREVRVVVLTKKAVDADLLGKLDFLFKKGGYEMVDLAGEWAYLHTPADVLKQVIEEHYPVFGETYIFHTSTRHVRDFQEELRSDGLNCDVRPIPSLSRR